MFWLCGVCLCRKNKCKAQCKLTLHKAYFSKMAMLPFFPKWNYICTMHWMLGLKLPTTVKTFNYGVKVNLEGFKVVFVQHAWGLDPMFFTKWLVIQVRKHQLHIFDSPYSRMISRSSWTFWKSFNVLYNSYLNWFWIFPLELCEKVAWS